MSGYIFEKGTIDQKKNSLLKFEIIQKLFFAT